MNSQNISIFLFLFVISIMIIPSLELCSTTCDHSLQLGGCAIICITLQNCISGLTIQLSFNTTVDTFSGLTVKNIASQLTNQSLSNCTANIKFQDNANNILTMLLTNNTSNKSRTVFSFVVNIQKGTFTGFKNDNPPCSNSSPTCSDGYQMDNSAYPSNTDPIFFISWIGTDVNGNYMLSQSKRLSRFSMYSLQNIFQKAKSIVSN